ncbi:MAG: PH domain-containing protein [Candidatus Vecturithrix sp.]|jgi:hypothetical protein|nr:PH domain-containing protein [Candidatus Vecturithrix sp.]
MEQIVLEELNPTENLLWLGQPKQGVIFRQSDYFAIPFSLVWSSAVIVYEYLAMTHKVSLFFILWGIPFLLLIPYATFGRFWIDSVTRKYTYYAITNENVRILSFSLFSQHKTIITLPLETLPITYLSESSHGFGTITFGRGESFWITRLLKPTRGKTQLPQFEMIENAKSVYTLLHEAQKK